MAPSIMISSDCQTVAQSLLTSISSLVRLLILGPLVNILKMSYGITDLFCRYIHSSNICYPSNQLDCFNYSGCDRDFQNYIGPGEDINSWCLFSNVPHGKAQLASFLQTSFHISPPPLSQFGSCSVSGSVIDSRYSLLFVYMCICSYAHACNFTEVGSHAIIEGGL